MCEAYAGKHAVLLSTEGKFTMELEFFTVTLMNLGINLIYTIVALVVSMVALVIVDKKLLPGISIEEEMKKGNIAVAIFASTILLFVAIIVTFGFKG